ncbi:hypothetical protein [Metabacillus malikii]|uniref:Uncharacterized protein n=1 Tax=Metabacillus malikii TaxID=1504265 RepID=A0ABT9ZIE1_9BACI|nr:hypothetical protein [Metabacillus malikii]MDQ0232044.1 hypothetical protein [Metabacillus malikii]
MTLTNEDRDYIEYITKWHLNKLPDGLAIEGKNHLDDLSVEKLVSLYHGTEQLISELTIDIKENQNYELLFKAIDYLSTKSLLESTIENKLSGQNIVFLH